MKNCNIWRDIGFFLLFLLICILLTQGGIVKYIILSGLMVCFWVYKRKVNIEFFLVTIHAVTYVMWGMAVAVLTNNLSFCSIKQSLIFLSAAFFSVSVFNLYGKERSRHLVDIQFIALCVGWLIMFARYLTIKEFYYESSYYAYIFGVYILVYFMRKKYIYMAIAVVFMGFEHKRIVVAAVILALLCMLFLLSTQKKIQKKVNKLAHVALMLLPILWIFLGATGGLGKIFSQLGINTMGRLEGTGAWNIARNYYKFSVFWGGKGSGWVLNWLENANILGFKNLHNDILTAYMELGFVGFCIWLVSFQYILVKARKLRGVHIANVIALLIGFMFINLLTDNIYLYVTFLVPFYIILLDIMFGEDNIRQAEGQI